MMAGVILINTLRITDTKTHHGETIVNINKLSPKQTEVFNLFYLECKTSDVIASELGLSKRTIEIHLSAILKKLGYKKENGININRKVLNDYYQNRPQNQITN